MLEKFVESIKNTKTQLAEQISLKDQLERQLEGVTESVLTTKGILVGLEYAKSLAAACSAAAKNPDKKLEE